jgi:hypothetical protein
MADESDDDEIKNELGRIEQGPVGEEQRQDANAPVNVPKTVIPRSRNYTKINNSAFSSLGNPKKGGSRKQRKSKKSRKSRKIKKSRKYKSRRR